MGERDTPVPATPRPGSGSGSGLSVGAGFAAGCLAAVVGVCVIGGAVAWWLASRVGLVTGPSSAGGSGLASLAVWAWVLLLVMAGHAAVSWWAWRTRPGTARVLLTQVPHAVVYVGAVAWWWATWPALYLLWTYATLHAAAWVTVWFLRAPQVARRAVVYLCALGVLVAVNTAGVLAVAWEKSNGFGWRGQTSPWAAFTALSATSCLTRISFYDNGSNTVPADCPSGPDADFFAGDYDETAFDNNTCNGQPREAFAKWWEWNHQYQLLFELDWTTEQSVIDGREIPAPYPEDAGGNRATIRYLMRVENVSNIGAANPHQIHADRLEETWTVEFEPVSLGGWKVCRIDVTDPIAATFTALDR